MKIALAGIALAAFAAAALAAPLASGLQPGESVTPFHPRHVAGPLKGTDKCFPCTFQNRPQVQVWVNGDDAKNVAALGGSLAKAMNANKAKEFKALVVFVHTPKTAKQVEATAMSLAKQPAMKGVGVALLPQTDGALSQYNINTAANVKNTVLVYKDWKVQENMVNVKADKAGLAKLDAAIAGITK